MSETDGDDAAGEPITPDDASTPDAEGEPKPDGTDARFTPRQRGILVVGPALVVVLAVIGFATLAARTTPGTPTAAAVTTPPTASPPAPGTTAGTTSTTEEPTTTTTGEPGTTTTTRKPRKPPTGPPGPLTGAPVDVPGYEHRQALVVKIDNYDPDARPQAGLTLADIVYEEKVEGPVSRFAAIFQGSDAEQVGPVRSARSTDVEIVGDLNRPLFAYSGANGGFQALLSISPLVDVGAGSTHGGAYWRGGDKVIPHNLYTSTAGLYAGTAGAPPSPLWPFRGTNQDPGPFAQPAVSGTYHFGGGMTLVNWRWDAAEKLWIRSQNGSIHYDMDNWPVGVANVVIQYVHYQGSTSTDIYGNPIPEASLGGVGRGWVLTGGAAIPMTWSRFGLSDPASYVGPDGKPIAFAPGHTWIALVPMELAATIAFANGTSAS